VDGIRRRLVAGCREELARTARLSLVGSSGDSVVVLTAAPESSVRDSLTRLAGLLGAEVPGLRPVWGVSSARDDAMELADAYGEARTAVRALRHVPHRTVSFYSDLGILRLMLADPRSTDLHRFVRETVGGVLDYDRTHGTALLETLRAYVDSGCSQQAAASRLFVHVKTVKYRLVQVEKLTGLDLAAHQDRLRVDIAVRAAELFAADSTAGQSVPTAARRPT
jgi:DNA-binding PucR family transcriptional regulator